jgi:hypothetical protein
VSVFSQRWAWLNFGKGGFQGHLGGLLIVVGLEIEPHIGWPAEVAFEAQGGVHGEGPLALDDLVDAPGRDANVLRDAVFREAKGNQEILAENLTRMNGSMRFHVGFRLFKNENISLITEL